MAMKDIMVVEDDLIIQLFISRVVQNAGFNVVGDARTCAQTLDVMKKIQPDLILMDIGLAGDRDGIETAALLKKKYDIPVVFITGNSDEATLQRAKEVGPLDFIFKPVDEVQLKSILIELSERMDDNQEK